MSALNPRLLSLIGRPSPIDRPDLMDPAMSGVNGNSRLTSATGMVLLAVLPSRASRS